MNDWRMIIERHGPAVWKTAYRLLGNSADAADCFQDTFVSALKFCRRRQVRNFPALLTRFATARAMDQLRRRFHRANPGTAPASCSAVTGESQCPSQAAQRQELIDMLRESLSRLPSREAEAFCMRYLSEMSYRQIADQLGITTNAAGVMIHRAKTKLKESFELSVKDNE